MKTIRWILHQQIYVQRYPAQTNSSINIKVEIIEGKILSKTQNQRCLTYSKSEYLLSTSGTLGVFIWKIQLDKNGILFFRQVLFSCKNNKCPSNWRKLTSFYKLKYFFYCSNFITYPKALFRTTFVIINNIYCIPTYVLWMTLLLPVKSYKPDLYYRIEGLFFHWLLSVVAMWSWTAGYDSKFGSNIVWTKVRQLFNRQFRF